MELVRKDGGPVSIPPLLVIKAPPPFLHQHKDDEVKKEEEEEEEEEDVLNSSLKIVVKGRVRGGGGWRPRWLWWWRTGGAGVDVVLHPMGVIRRQSQQEQEQYEEEEVKIRQQGTSASAICEGFVIRSSSSSSSGSAAADGDPLFTVGEHVGSGAFGACFRCVRNKRPQQRYYHRHDDVDEEEEEKDAKGFSTMNPVFGSPNKPDKRRSPEEEEEEEEYAVKVLKNLSPALLAELAIEARLMFHISRHRNVAALRFVYLLGGGDRDDAAVELLIFTDLVKGGGKDLAAALKSGSLYVGCGPSRRDVSAKLMDVSLQIANGLAHLHSECHVIHFDIKPGNVCIDINGSVKLIDFGLSARGRLEYMRLSAAADAASARRSSLVLVWRPMALWLWGLCFMTVLWGIYFYVINWTTLFSMSRRLCTIATCIVVARIGWQHDLANYPVLRRQRADTPVLHAEMKGGTRGFFSPEFARAFEHKCATGNSSRLCAAETDLWAWAIITARLFKPPASMCRGCEGESMGDAFRKHYAAEEPERTQDEWLCLLRAWNAAQVHRWLSEDLAAAGITFVRSFVALFKNPDNTGEKLANVLGAVSLKEEREEWTKAFEKDGNKTRWPYLLCLRKIRQVIFGGTDYEFPRGLRGLLARSFASDKFARPMLMKTVVDELAVIAAQYVAGERAASKNRLPPPVRGRAETHLRQTVDEVNDDDGCSHRDNSRIARVAQKVAALVNCSKALSVSTKLTNESEMLNERISLLAEALEVQRDAAVDGVDDNAGGLLHMLAQACFLRHRRASIASFFLLFVVPFGITDLVYAAGSRLQYKTPSPPGYAYYSASLSSCGSSFPDTGALCMQDGDCGEDWYCQPFWSTKVGDGTWWTRDWHYKGPPLDRYCVPCTWCHFYSSTLKCDLAEHNATTCSRVEELLQHDSGRRDDCEYDMSFVYFLDSARSLVSLLSLAAICVLLYVWVVVFDLFPPRGASIQQRSTALVQQFRSRFLVFGTGAFAPILVRWRWKETARLSSGRCSRTGAEAWWWQSRGGEREGRGAGMRRRLQQALRSNPHLPWKLEKYWRNFFRFIFLCALASPLLFQNLDVFIIAVCWELPFALRLFRRRLGTLCLLLFVVTMTYWVFVFVSLIFIPSAFLIFCGLHCEPTSTDSGCPAWLLAPASLFRMRT